MNDNIVKLVFQSLSNGSGFDDVISGGSKAQKTLQDLSGAARLVGRVFGPLGGILGNAFGMFLQGNIWSVAAIGVDFLFKKMGWLQDGTQKTTEYFDKLRKSIEDFAATSERAFRSVSSIQDKRQNQYADELDSVNALKKAELELARERERANGGTGETQDAAIAALGEKGARDKAEDAVYRATQRVEAAEKRMADAEEAIKNENHAGPNTGKEERLKVLYAEKKAAREALDDERSRLEIAKQAQEALEKSQEAAHLKAQNDAKAEAEAKAKAEAEAREKQAQKDAEESEKDAKEFVEAYEKEKEADRKKEEAEEKKAEERRLKRELDENKRRAADLQQRMEDALRNAEIARQAFADRGNLDLGGEEKARRREAANNERLKKTADRLKAHGIDLDNPGRRLSREEEAARRWMIQEREKDKNVKELAEVNKTLKKIEAALEAATTL